MPSVKPAKKPMAVQAINIKMVNQKPARGLNSNYLLVDKNTNAPVFGLSTLALFRNSFLDRLFNNGLFCHWFCLADNGSGLSVTFCFWHGKCAVCRLLSEACSYPPSTRRKSSMKKLRVGGEQEARSLFKKSD